MNSICFYYFSGTGMTKYVVDKLTSEFEKHSIHVDCFKIEEANIHNTALSGYDALGIAYPIHAFNAPKIVIDFAKRLPITSGMSTFIINTGAEEHIINYASSDLLIKKLKKTGYNVFYNKLIEMPSNFATKYTDKKVREILENANKDIPPIAKDIVELKPYYMKKSCGSKILTFIARAEWFGAPLMGKFFSANSSCVRCGECIKNCPSKNIVMNTGGRFSCVRLWRQENRPPVLDTREPSPCVPPVFKWRCGICMRCIYICPKNAVRVRQPLKFIRFDEWYDSEIFK